MNPINDLMEMALNYRLAGSASRDEHESILRTALTELLATTTEYQQACDKMAWKHKLERDTLRKQLAESKAEVSRLELLQFRQAPCHKFCEATAFEIEIRNLKSQLAEAQALKEIGGAA